MATARPYDPTSTSPYVRTLTSNYAWTPGDTVTFYLKPTDLDDDGRRDLDQTGAAAALRQAAAAWSAVADIAYKEVTRASKADWTEEMVQNDEGYAGLHYYPFDSSGKGVGGTYNMMRSTKADNAVGGINYSVYVHELGHGLGLAHTHKDDVGERSFPGVSSESDLGNHGLNQQIYSVMSYNYGWDAVTPPSDTYGWIGGPMAFDIAAVQEMYGANTETAKGNTTYTLPTANKAGTFFSCLWDAGGTDTIRAGDTRLSVSINLAAATLRDEAGGGGVVSRAKGILGGFTIAHDVTIENALGGRGNDTLVGNDASNRLDGGGGADTLRGGRGNDLYIVDSVKDTISERAGWGTDGVRASVDWTLSGAVENLRLEGRAARGTGNDAANDLTGNDRANTLSGLNGNDRLKGGAGDDRLDGGLGADTLTGGAGADRFLFSTALGRSNVDAITDFDGAGDLIQLENSVFAALRKTGELAASLFKDLSLAATDKDDRVLYDHAKGDLFYDADGSGRTEAVRFAHLAPKTALAADSVLVV